MYGLVIYEYVVVLHNNVLSTVPTEIGIHYAVLIIQLHLVCVCLNKELYHIITNMWACGHVGMWACGHVGMCACLNPTNGCYHKVP